MSKITLTLASKSPQRSMLLTSIGITFDCWAPSGNEESSAEHVATQAQEIARNKAEQAQKNTKSMLILSADTLVEVGGQAYGKPANYAAAEAMLKTLSGNAHKVHTAICLYDRRQESWKEAFDSTNVHFSSMNEQELQWLMAANEWQDAAGSYKIQGRAACFVKKIEGSYTNVLGLPICLLYSILSGYNDLFTQKKRIYNVLLD